MVDRRELPIAERERAGAVGIDASLARVEPADRAELEEERSVGIEHLDPLVLGSESVVNHVDASTGADGDGRGVRELSIAERERTGTVGIDAALGAVFEL